LRIEGQRPVKLELEETHQARLAGALARSVVPHAAHVFAHGPHSLGLARGAGDAKNWTGMAARWIREQL
jgi:hypothetical protein